MSGSNRLPALAAEIVRAHAEARRAAQMTVAKAIEAGEALIEAKALCEHGEWLPWLKANCAGISERSVQSYMRIARLKRCLPEIRNAADLTMRGALDALTEPRLPEKLSERVEAVRYLPLAGHVKIGLRDSEAGWDEIWIAPSFQHPRHCYVTHIWSPREGGAYVTGSRRPVRCDFVTPLLMGHLSCDLDGMEWRDEPFPAWTRNILLYPDGESYIDSLDVREAEDRAEVVEIATQAEPQGFGVQVKVHANTAGQPLAALVFGGAS